MTTETRCSDSVQQLCVAVSEKQRKTSATQMYCVCACVRVSVCVWGNQSNWSIKHPHMTAQKTTAVWMTSCLHCTKVSCTGTVRYVRNEPGREWERMIKASWLCPYVLMILDITVVFPTCIFGAKKKETKNKPSCLYSGYLLPFKRSTLTFKEYMYLISCSVSWEDWHHPDLPVQYEATACIPQHKDWKQL